MKPAPIDWGTPHDASGAPWEPVDATAAPAVREPLTNKRLLDLLARIHRDGGHYVAAHGIDKACADADLLLAEMLVRTTEQVPLTDAQIVECANASDMRTELWDMGAGSLIYSEYCSGIPRGNFTTFVRQIERAHGITGDSNG